MTAARLQISKSDIVVIRGQRFEVARSGAPGVEIVSTDASRTVAYKSHDELKTLYFAKELTLQRGQVVKLPQGVAKSLQMPLPSFSAAEQATAMMRLDYVTMCERYFTERRVPKTLKGYAHVGRVVSWLRRRAAIRDSGRSVVPRREMFGPSTLRGWHWRWRDAGRNLNALIPLDYLKGRNTPKTNSTSLAIVERHVRDEWLTETCPPLTIVYESLVAEVDAFNQRLAGAQHGSGLRPAPLQAPSLSTVRRWVKGNIDDYDAVMARKGKKEAERRFRGVRRAPQPTRPLQIVQVDHHLLDIEILNDTAPHGSRRPWLTVAICSATRMIYGFHIGFEPPSWLSVMACLRMGALPKDGMLNACRSGPMRVEGDWPVFGLPEVLVVDNGKDFHSNSLKAAAGQLGFELRYTPTRRPHLKGKVERFFGEVARNFVAFLPGRTFASIKEKGDYDPIAKAALSMSELQAAFLLWMVDYHHHKPHRGILLQAPLQRWKELSAYGVRVPPSANDITAFLGLVIDRSIQQKGVEYLGLLYQSHEVQLLRRRPGGPGRKWTVKADPFDLSMISVLDEEQQKWIDVPSVDPELTDGLDIRTYRRILEETRAEVKAGQKIHVSHLLEARRKLMAFGKDKGVAPASKSVEIDMDWFRANVSDPIVRVSDRGRKGINPLDRRRLESRDRTENGEAGASRSETSAQSRRELEAPPLQPELDSAADLARRMPIKRHDPIDPDDSDNWE